MNSKRTQPHIYMYPFSTQSPSHPAWHIMLNRVPCNVCIIYLLLYNKLLKFSCLKQQKNSIASMRSLRSLMRLPSKYWPDVWSHQKAQLGRICFQIINVVDGRNYILVSVWLRVTALHWLLTLVSCDECLSTGQFKTWCLLPLEVVIIIIKEREKSTQKLLIEARAFVTKYHKW